MPARVPSDARGDLGERRDDLLAERFERADRLGVGHVDDDVLDALVGLAAERRDHVRRPLPARAQVSLQQRGLLDLLVGPPHRLAVAAQDLELVAAFAGVRHENVAGVAVGRDEPQGYALAAAADEDRRVRSRDWLRIQERIRRPDVAAIERGTLAAPHLVGQLQGLLESFESLAPSGEGDSQPTRLGLVPAGAESQVGSTTRQHIQRRGDLHEQARLAKVDGPNEGPQPDPGRGAGQEAEGRVCLEHRRLRPAQAGIGRKLPEVVHDPQAGEARPFGGAGDLAQAGADGGRSIGPGEGRELQADEHRDVLSCRGW
jgi:hypothetical protein